MVIVSIIDNSRDISKKRKHQTDLKLHLAAKHEEDSKRSQDDGKEDVYAKGCALTAHFICFFQSSKTGTHYNLQGSFNIHIAGYHSSTGKCLFPPFHSFTLINDKNASFKCMPKCNSFSNG